MKRRDRDSLTRYNAKRRRMRQRLPKRPGKRLKKKSVCVSHKMPGSNRLRTKTRLRNVLTRRRSHRTHWISLVDRRKKKTVFWRNVDALRLLKAML